MRIQKTLIVLVLVSFIIFALFAFSSLRVTYSELEKQVDEARVKLAECEAKIERYESDKNCDIDDAFIERIARERLNLCHPNEIIMEYQLNQ